MDQSGFKMIREGELKPGERGTGNGRLLFIRGLNDRLWFFVDFLEVSTCEETRDDI